MKVSFLVIAVLFHFDTILVFCMQTLLEKATRHVADVIRDAIKHSSGAKALVVFDRDSGLSSLLADAYQYALPQAQMMDFRATTPVEVRQTIDALSPGDLVVLVQSTSFRLNEFRFRLELFNRSLAVIEHPHLGRMGEHEYEIYIDALAYDQDYYHSVGKKLKSLIDRAQRVVVSCEGTELVYETPLEDAKLNIGDYTGMKNTGGQFPIGEVFTEPKNIAGVNGWVKLYAFGDAGFHVIIPDEPVLVRIEKGVLVEAPHAPESFVKVLDQIKADEEVWVRELGFGMNRALTRNRVLTDIGSYERMCGIHLSLGQKHTIYAKPGMPKRSSKYHVDVFVDVTRVMIDDVVVYEHGSYLLP
jgi:aminopeptidase